MKTNIKSKTVRVKTKTHGGAITYEVSAKEQLRRAVMTCLLWEDQFYESGESIADRIKELIPKVEPVEVANIAIEARQNMKLRHVPLLIVREMARLDTHKEFVANTLYSIIERADELAEFLSIYWADGKQPISAQVKRGLALAFKKFDEYALAKYNRDAKVKLRDVLFMVHAKPDNTKQEKLWKKLVENKLETPDTWETELSAGKDKKLTFERLIKEEKLGALALLRNLRNMKDSGVSPSIIFKALETVNTKRVLPFRFLTAAKYAPQWESHIEKALFKSVEQKPKLKGKTVFVIDTSGSMRSSLSAKSELNRIDTAKSLAIIAREVCEEVAIYATAGNDHTCVHATSIVPDRRGFGLSDSIDTTAQKLGGGGIFLTQVTEYIRTREKDADRIIVITDEQDCDRGVRRSPDNADAYAKNNYIINIGSYKNGIAYKKKWIHISGWSESVLDYINYSEQN